MRRMCNLIVASALAACGSEPEAGTYAIDDATALAREQYAVPHDGRALERRVLVFHAQSGNAARGKPGSCYAFLAAGARWRTTEPYALDASNQDGLDPAYVATAIDNGLRAWDEQVSFAVFGALDGGALVDGLDVDAPDGLNEVVFGSISDPGAIAVTFVWGFFSGPPKSRELLEWDTLFDDDEYLWGDAGPTNELALGDSTVMDLENVGTHELGHAAGMGHPESRCSEETMYAYAEEGETKKRTLHTGDRAGIVALYP